MESTTDEVKTEQQEGTRAGLARLRWNVAGIDIGARKMQVCAPVSEQAREVRTYETTTEEILNCACWLKQVAVESVAMESTGVYWIPVLEMLESCGMETLLVDTRPLSRVPGRKTDVNDCQWIQTLHSHGLLQGSFRPSEEISQLRILVRQKAVLVSEQADWTRRMHKSLDQMNVRVHHAVSDLQGTTGMAIIRAIVGGERDPKKLAGLRDPRCRNSQERIAALLTGHWREDHLFNLKQSLEVYDCLGQRIADYEEEIQKRMKGLAAPGSAEKKVPPLPQPERMKAIKRRGQQDRRQALFEMAGVDLTTIGGIGVETAEVILSEYGVDLSKFETEKEFVSHLQLAPHQNITGGKPRKKGRRKTKGTRAGKALRSAALGQSRSATALGAYYRRLALRKESDVAVFATARKLATHVYRLLRWGQAYVDIGQKAYEALYDAGRLRRLKSTAAQFGYQLVQKTEAVTA